MGRQALAKNWGTMVEEGAMKRIGLFGGSFNPVHLGHLRLARAAKRQLALDEVWFVPCARSADGKTLAPGRLRLRWLKKAVKGQEGFKVCDLEMKRGGVSRTITTLRKLRSIWGGRAEFTLLVGQDQAAQFDTWKEADKIPGMAGLAAFKRDKVGKRAAKGFRFQWVKYSYVDISSSEIRLRIKQKKSVLKMLPSALIKDPDIRQTFR